MMDIYTALEYIEQVMAEEADSEVVIEKNGRGYTATVREDSGEIVDSGIELPTMQDALGQLGENCEEYLRE